MDTWVKSKFRKRWHARLQTCMTSLKFYIGDFFLTRYTMVILCHPRANGLLWREKQRQEGQKKWVNAVGFYMSQVVWFNTPTTACQISVVRVGFAHCVYVAAKGKPRESNIVSVRRNHFTFLQPNTETRTHTRTLAPRCIPLQWLLCVWEYVWVCVHEDRNVYVR